ncbi:exonuclease domain-containing protein [Promicromonospora sp. NPDC023987]|uniref:exonuclease domain-containing protein n=1 Tax=Promicromonospora sp. NPDC023987 TaxID=3155360 RepID=UPI0033F9BE9F
MPLPLPLPGLSFTAIDFETANPNKASVCAVGVARVRDGQVVETLGTLVRPPTGYDEFGYYNVRAHGIQAQHVASAPSWRSVHATIVDFIGADPIVAYNVPADRAVFEKASAAYQLAAPRNAWVDALRLARRHLVLPKYSLPQVTSALGLPSFTHHDALADTIAAAHVTVALCHQAGLAAFAGPDALAGVSPARRPGAGWRTGR